jgi:chromosomal replication initiator protein
LAVQYKPGERPGFGAEPDRGDALAGSRFVPLPENRAARLAVRRLARQLAGNTRGPDLLTLHGPPGTGKSHLLAALVATVARVAPDRSAVTLPAADLNPAADEPDWPAARACDLLLVEDLHHLSAAGGAALANLLDHRLRRRRPAVCTATAGPGQLPHLPLRLRSRLAGGLVVGLEPLSGASRRRLLDRLTAGRNLAARPEVLDWLSTRPGSARQLLGGLARLEQVSRGRAEPPDLETVRAALAEPEPAGDVLGKLVRLVSRHFRLDPRTLRGPSRRRQTLWARQVAMALARDVTGLPLVVIGAYFGGRDHTTVLHACRQIAKLRESHPDINQDVNFLLQVLRS